MQIKNNDEIVNRAKKMFDLENEVDYIYIYGDSNHLYADLEGIWDAEKLVKIANALGYIKNNC